jgi:hypothetical protein
VVGDGALIARRAREHGELDEEVQHIGRHRRRSYAGATMRR